MKFERSSGILMHITSLPNKYGIGSLGKECLDFVDFLVESKQKLWQIFPLGPTGYGDSPYQCFSAFAGNPLLISLEELKKINLLSNKDIEIKEKFDDNKVDYGRVINFRAPILKKAYQNFKKTNNNVLKSKYEIFCKQNKEWLDDFALFMAIKEKFGGRAWNEWDKDIKMRKPEAVAKYKKELEDNINYQKFLQFIFFQQWLAVKSYANMNGVKIIGDIPIFVAFDSADAWANPEIFFFDENRNPTKVAGVPPDYFSETGQLWGNPLYNWDKLKENGYDWWIKRVKFALNTCDIIRIDHFRGFAAYWAVPYGEKTAVKGTWEKGPGLDLFNAIHNALGNLPIIAEDLGVITPDVVEIRDGAGFPGMKILQFAFDSSEENNYIPHSFSPHSVVYTGTHDNDTTLGWYKSAKESDKKYCREYMNSNGKNIVWDFIRLAFASVSCIAIIPMQDILNLGSEARMNTPGKASGNWQWRMRKGMITKNIKEKLRKLTELYGR